MWGRVDFDEIEQLHEDAAEDYSKPGRRNMRARTFFVSLHNLHDVKTEIEMTGGHSIGEKHYMQLMYLSRGIQALRSTYWLVKNHCYTACYGRIRFLIELYLVVRELNKEKGKTQRKWQRAVDDITQNYEGLHSETYLTNFFKGKRKQLRGELTDENEAYNRMYRHISDMGAHPDSILSTGLEGSLDQKQEQDIVSFGLIFVYAIAAQYRRTFENSSIQEVTDSRMDEVMVQSLLVLDDLPVFLEDDLEYSA